MKIKSGNISIYIFTLSIILMIIILVIIFLLYMQINSVLFNFKSDLFYITQNVYLAADYNELAYANYEFDNTLLQDKIIYLLKLNYPNYTIFMNKMEYQYENKEFLVDINLLVEPIVLKDMIGNIKLNITEKIKFKLMEVNSE